MSLIMCLCRQFPPLHLPHNYELSTLFRHFSSVPREFISDDRVSAFVIAKTGIDPGPHTALGIFQGGKVTVGFLFNHYTGRDIGLTLAIAHPRALTKEFLRRCGHYAFHELRVARVTMFTEQPAVVSIARRCGAEIEGVKRDAFGPGRNAIMLGLLARDWKFK